MNPIRSMHHLHSQKYLIFSKFDISNSSCIDFFSHNHNIYIYIYMCDHPHKHLQSEYYSVCCFNNIFYSIMVFEKSFFDELVFNVTEPCSWSLLQTIYKILKFAHFVLFSFFLMSLRLLHIYIFFNYSMETCSFTSNS